MDIKGWIFWEYAGVEDLLEVVFEVILKVHIITEHAAGAPYGVIPRYIDWKLKS